MNILFITSSRIGDAVLSTGLLAYIEKAYPAARVTIACGSLTVSLFEGYPNLEKIISLKKQKYNRHWIDLWWQVAGTRWDMVIDLRNSAVSRFVLANKRFIFGGHIDASRHKVEQAAQLMKLKDIPAPALWFTKEQEEKTRTMMGAGRILGVGPAANWQGKTWPAERFIEIIGDITAPEGILPGARVAVFAAPGEEAIANTVLNSVPADRQIDMIAKGNPGMAAAALARCSFYIGNDSGLMHCAAAAGVPTLGLFGPSYLNLYRPWGAHCDYVSTPENYDELINYPGYTPKTAPCLMESLTVDMVRERLELFREKLKK